MYAPSTGCAVVAAHNHGRGRYRLLVLNIIVGDDCMCNVSVMEMIVNCVEVNAWDVGSTGHYLSVGI
jgi:hypothetical protein